jgi:hypothetical protein
MMTKVQRYATNDQSVGLDGEIRFDAVRKNNGTFRNFHAQTV